MTHLKVSWHWQDGILYDSHDNRILTHMAGHPKENKNYPLIAAAPILLDTSKYTFNCLQRAYQLLNCLASGESMKQWSRVEPQAILAEIYGILATPFNELKQTIAKAEGKEV